MGGLAVLSLSLLLVAGCPAQAFQLDPLHFRGLFAQAIQLHSEGEFRRSYDTLERALLLCRDDKQEDWAGRCLIRMGLLKWDLGDSRGAAQHFEEAAELFSRDHDRCSREFCLASLEIIRLQDDGLADRKARLFYQALDHFSEAVVLARELGLPDLEAKCLRHLALSHFEMGNLDFFREMSQRGLALASLIHHRIEQCRCFNNIGVYYQRRFDYVRAIRNLEKALSMAQEVGDRETETNSLSNLGLLHQEIGNTDRAHFYLSETLARDQADLNPSGIAIDLTNIGSVLCRRGIDQANRSDLIDAQEALQRSISVQERMLPNPLIAFTTLNNLGVILNELGDPIGARDRFEQAWKIAEKDPSGVERTHALVNIAATYLNEGNLKEAEARYRASLQTGSGSSLESVLMEAYFGLGQCAERSGDLVFALSCYRKSIAALENIRSRLSEPLMIGFTRNKLRVFERAADLLASRAQAEEPGSLEEIYDLFESAKARALMESLREAHADISELSLQEQRDRLKAIDRNISELATRLKRGENSSEENREIKVELEREEEESVRLSLELKHSGPKISSLWGSELCPLGEIQKRLFPGPSVLLEYFLGERRSYLLRVSATDARLYQLPGRAELERSLRAYVKSLSDPSLAPEIITGASERARLVVLPVEDEVFRKAKAVIVVPDGILHYLPFETLRSGQGSHARYLIEDTAVSYVPSASVMAVLMDQSHPRSWAKEVLAIGPPSRSRPRLPFGRQEVREIARSCAMGTVDVLIGEDVDESALKARRLSAYRIVHFACHGDLDEAYPLRSSLILTAREGSDDDGFLQAREIYGLKLDAELVVLSACQTGRGRLERSEGLLALARPFFVAGAQAVIASLWPLNDRSSAVFMGAFYRELASGRPASESLRSAKIRMLKSPWAHPFYWAPFVLQGAPSISAGTGISRVTSPID